MNHKLSIESNCNEDNLNLNNYYEYLQDNWSSIFPDGNRNAAGALFFKFIISIPNLNYQDFIEFNKLYCAVSGSLVSPNSEPTFIKLKDLNNNIICGDYYLCCWPCSCDIMKYANIIEVNHQFCDQDYPTKFHVIVIKNPCGKLDFPSEVNKNYFCNGNLLNSNNVIILNVNNQDYLVIGLLHESYKCSNEDINFIDNHEITGSRCKERNNTPLEQLNYGMGDIFIKLAK